MSKKRDKNTKDNKDKKDSNDTKHCKNKNTNGKKWEPPSGYYKEYEARRRGEGRVTKLRIKALTALLDLMRRLPIFEIQIQYAGLYEISQA